MALMSDVLLRFAGLAGSSPLPVFKSSSDEGYFPKIFSRVTKVDAPVQGMLTIVIIQERGWR
ncbi:hypothetical protein DMI70_12605 [Escherichia coli]|nr:hypothetical protein [Escherichia coli]